MRGSCQPLRHNELRRLSCPDGQRPTPGGPPRATPGETPTPVYLREIFCILISPSTSETVPTMSKVPEKSKIKRKYVNRIGLREAVIDNERLVGTPQYKTVAELAAEFETIPATVYTIRHRLKIPSNEPGGSNTPTVALRLINESSHEGLIRILETEPLLTSLDRLKILSRLIRTGPPAVKIQAIKTFEDITKTTTDRVGPPAPLNEDEAIARLARLLIAIGKPITDKACLVAFGDPGEAPESGPQETLQPESGPLPLAGTLAETALPDLRGEDGAISSPAGGPRPRDGSDPGPPLPSLQSRAGDVPGQPDPDASGD